MALFYFAGRARKLCYYGDVIGYGRVLWEGMGGYYETAGIMRHFIKSNFLYAVVFTCSIRRLAVHTQRYVRCTGDVWPEMFWPQVHNVGEHVLFDVQLLSLFSGGVFLCW